MNPSLRVIFIEDFLRLGAEWMWGILEINILALGDTPNTHTHTHTYLSSL